MGGDEFLLFLPKVNSEQAEKILAQVIEQFKGIVRKR